MSRNLEIKVKINSISKAVQTAQKIGASDNGTLQQQDIYYNIRKNRLKLRIINNKSAELIYYKRANKKNEKYSDYLILNIPQPQKAKNIFSAVFGVKVIVLKKRRLFLYKNARIHIDQVSGLGTFLEFEVVENKGKTQAVKLMEYLKDQFSVRTKNIIAKSYSDLILKKKK